MLKGTHATPPRTTPSHTRDARAVLQQQLQSSTSSGQPIVQATPMLNMETFMQQAVQAFRQLEANPPCSGAAPQAHPPQPQPEGLSTASQQPLSATGIGCARIVCTQSFGEEAHYSLGRARELFPGFGSPKPEFPTPSSGSPNSGVGKCQKSGFGKPPFSAREWGVA